MTPWADWPEWAIGVLVVAIIVVPAFVLAWLMRAARFMGGGGAACAVAGGILAGVLMGPGVLGRSAPDFYERVFVGAVHERETRQRLAREHAFELAVLKSSDVTPEAVDELRAAHGEAIDPLIRAEFAAIDRRAETVGAMGLGLAAGALVLPYFLRAAGSSRRPMSPSDRLRARLAGAIGAGLVIAVCVAILAAFVGVDHRAAAAFGAACAAGWAAPGARARRTGPNGRDPRMDQASATSLGVSLLTGAALLSSVWLAVAAIPGVAGLRRPGGRRFGRFLRRKLHGLVYAVLAPSACAAAAMRLDPYVIVAAGGKVLWIGLILALLASTDGRWCGMAVGWLATLGRRGLATAMERATGQLASGVGIAQCALTLLLHTGGIIGDAMALALLASAVLTETMVGAYRFFTRQVEDVLEESGELA